MHRYEAALDEMEARQDGDFILFSDYQELEAERDLEAALREDAYRYQQAAEDLLNPYMIAYAELDRAVQETITALLKPGQRGDNIANQLQPIRDSIAERLAETREGAR